MEFEGTKEVFRNLFRKKRLLESGDPQHASLRPALIVLSGTMRGVYGGGQVIALEESGLTGAFDVAVGSSTGSPAVAYFLSGKALLGTSVYTSECTTPAFISPRRAARRMSIEHAVDLDYIARVFKGDASAKAIPLAALRASRTACYAAVTRVSDGAGRFFDMKQEHPDAIELIRASIAIPGISRSITIDDVPYCDGSVGHPFPAREIWSCFDPTDILVLANRASGFREEGLLRTLIERRSMRHATPLLQEAILNRQARLDEGVEWLRNQTVCRYGILWSDTDVRGFTRDPKKLTSAVERSRTHLRGYLDAARAAV